MCCLCNREREERDQLRLAKRDLGWLVHTMIKTTISSYSSPPPSPGEGGAVGVARFLEVMSSIISEPMYVKISSMKCICCDVYAYVVMYIHTHDVW